MRIRILDILRDGPLTVNELTVSFGGTQQNISKHVGGLRRQASELEELLA